MLTMPWSTRTRMTSDKGIPIKRSSERSFSVVDIRKLYTKMKRERSKAGLPRRKMSPVCLWLLDYLMEEYLKEHASTHTLESIEAKRGEL